MFKRLLMQTIGFLKKIYSKLWLLVENSSFQRLSSLNIYIFNYPVIILDSEFNSELIFFSNLLPISEHLISVRK